MRDYRAFHSRVPLPKAGEFAVYRLPHGEIRLRRRSHHTGGAPWYEVESADGAMNLPPLYTSPRRQLDRMGAVFVRMEPMRP